MANDTVAPAIEQEKTYHAKVEVKATMPAVRFNGFTDSWELRQFDSIYRKVGEKNDLTYGIDRIISVANMYFKKNSYITDDEYLKTYNVFKLGDIAFEGNKSKHFAHGRFVENTIGDGIVSHVFDVFRPKTEYDLSYWKYAINNENLMGDILIRSTKSSTMMTNLVADDFLKESIRVPRVNEQRMIGKYFDQLDTLIDLQRRQLKKMQNFKKSMLDKMLPKDGSNIPEIRFAGFTDPWELRSFSEIVTVGSGKDYKHLGRGNVPVYGTGGYMLSVDKALSYKKDAIGIGRKGTIDKPYLLKAPFWTVDTLFYCTPRYPFDLLFTLQLFRKIDWKQKDESTGVPSLSKETIHAVEIMTPGVKEQKKIGNLINKIDTLIDLEQSKLEKLQTVKKACLEKMFV